jgi:hypothetical protein
MPRMRPCSVAMRGSAAAVFSKVAQLATSAMTSNRMALIDRTRISWPRSPSSIHRRWLRLLWAESSDAPPVPDAHPGLGKPSCRWPYRDAAGRLLFEVWRFDPVGKRKIFLPLSLWRDASGALRWLWKSVPAPRPLYGLDRLAAMADAPVVVCEGSLSNPGLCTSRGI